MANSQDPTPHRSSWVRSLVVAQPYGLGGLSIHLSGFGGGCRSKKGDRELEN